MTLNTRVNCFEACVNKLYTEYLTQDDFDQLRNHTHIKPSIRN